MHRQFFGWRITKDTQPLFPDTIQRCIEQTPIRLKSGQEPPMYSKMHLTNWIERVEEWSKNVFDEYCYNHTVQSGKNNGKTFRICKRFMPASNTYLEYSSQEKDLLRPGRGWWFDGEWNEICPPPAVRDVTEDIMHDEEHRKRAAQVDLTSKRRRKRVKKSV